MPDDATQQLLAFYRGEAGDHRGRTIEDILTMSLDELESRHDFIQWLFPLREPSPVNPYAPVLTNRAEAEFRASPELRTRQRRAFETMLRFYGFRLVGGDDVPTVERTPTFAERARVWLLPDNHNHLRITRMLASLRLCGSAHLAHAFLRALREVAREFAPAVSRRSLAFWESAVDPAEAREASS